MAACVRTEHPIVHVDSSVQHTALTGLKGKRSIVKAKMALYSPKAQVLRRNKRNRYRVTGARDGHFNSRFVGENRFRHIGQRQNRNK
ncbi:MAG: hypothetical protein II069_01795 [Oscillospiraceae bacterium]|nr:hypothetical protein [Oscillospiraceae bacterium]